MVNARYKVSGRELEGFKYVFRTLDPVTGHGRAWPRGEGFELVELVDQDEDPARAEDGTIRIGRLAFKELSDDPQIRIVPAEPFSGATEMSSALVAAHARIAELETQVAALEGQLDTATRGKGSIKGKDTKGAGDDAGK